MKHTQKNLIGYLADWLTWKRLIFSIVMIFFLTGILFPFYWMVSSSFKTKAEIGGREPVYIPSGFKLDAYRELFDPNHPSYQNFGINIVNTLKVSLPTSVIAIILAILGAYAIARFKFKGRNLLLNGILLVYLFTEIWLMTASIAKSYSFPNAIISSQSPKSESTRV